MIIAGLKALSLVRKITLVLAIVGLFSGTYIAGQLSVDCSKAKLDVISVVNQGNAEAAEEIAEQVEENNQDVTDRDAEKSLLRSEIDGLRRSLRAANAAVCPPSERMLIAIDD